MGNDDLPPLNITEHNGSGDRESLVAMITSTPVLSKVAQRWERDSLISKDACILGSIVVRYYKKHNACPGSKNIVKVLEHWAESQRDRATVTLVHDALAGIMSRCEEQEREPTNPDYLIDFVGDHLKRARIYNHLKKVNNALTSKEDVSKIEDLVAGYSRVEMGKNSVEDFYNNPEVLKSVFTTELDESVITYPGDLGKFWGRSLCRGAFIALVGVEKSGKSFMLVDMAYMAVSQRKRTLLFQVGDLTKQELYKRLVLRTVRHPFHLDESEYKWPERIIKKKDEPTKVSSSILKFEKALDYTTAQAKFQKFIRSRVKSDEVYFKVSTHSNFSIDVQGIADIVKEQADKGWVADCVLIDYADVLADPKGFSSQDFRHRTNETWSRLRALSMDFHCLLVTATQAKQSAYNAKWITREHASEDKRKNSHITGMVGINRTEDEEADGLCRLRWTFRREGKKPPPVYVAGNLALASPCVVSCF